MQLGRVQELIVDKKVDFGIYLVDAPGDQQKVLLPKKQVPPECTKGERIRVFLYRDSRDRLIATTTIPKLTMDSYGVLAVKEVTKIGAFLDWGLEKDLFLPYKEMTRKVHSGDEILVRLYEDKSGRLCASTKGLYPLLAVNPPYHIGDELPARIYEFGHDFGTFVAVEDRYSAMLPKHEDVSAYRLGDVLMVTVAGLKEDGKLDVTLRKKAYLQMDEDALKVLEIIDSYAGVLPFTEKASPEVIFRETGLSKGAFKRAVGHLYKERKISITQGKIRRV
jgi:hypothetical protein